MAIKKLVDLDVTGKRVLIRQDLNVPLRNGEITSSKRIEASLPTIKYARDQGARVMLMSHLGRPVEGEPDSQFSLQPVAEYLASSLDQPVRLITDYLESSHDSEEGQVDLLENVRFNPGEVNNDPALGKKYAALCDIFVMDAFGTAHRAQASTCGVGMYSPIACAGPLLDAELKALQSAIDQPTHPVVAIVGGAKVSTKLTVLECLSGLVDKLVPGGGIANTFIAAAGHCVGKSLYEPELLNQAETLMGQALERGAEIPVPTDVVVGNEFSKDAIAKIKPVNQVDKNELILDIGPETANRYAGIMKAAGTIVWNGPVGVFEYEQFSLGTKILGTAIAESPAFSIAGGGDTLAAIEKFNLTDRISYISTGGGAFLEFLEGKILPAVEMLQIKGQNC